MKTTLLAIACLGLAFYLHAAEAPKPEPAPTVEAVSAERDALKKEVADLQTQVAQLSAAAAKLQEQRNAALDAEVQRAMQAAKK